MLINGFLFILGVILGIAFVCLLVLIANIWLERTQESRANAAHEKFMKKYRDSKRVGAK